MPEYVPATRVMVCRNVPLDSSYSDTIKFNSLSEQQAFFQGKAKYTYTENTYQRVNSSVAQPRGPLSLRIPTVADNVYDCNYVCFQNTNFGTKWFYAFIKQVNYINPNNTEIIYELDHYQTWAFDFTVLPSFVEREHTSDDSYFSNEEPEPVNIGLMKCTGVKDCFNQFPDSYLVVGYATTPDGKSYPGGTSLNGRIYSGLQFKSYSSFSACVSEISQYADKGTLDNVVMMFMSPFDISDWNEIQWSATDECGLPSNLDGYTPRNNKLFSYPFIKLEFSSSDGQATELQYEKFGTSQGPGQFEVNVSFEMFKGNCPNPAIVCSPQNYDRGNQFGTTFPGSKVNGKYTLSLSDFPTCMWVGNSFANWYAQNKNTQFMNVFKGFLKSGYIAQDNLGGGIVSAGVNVADYFASLSDRNTDKYSVYGSAVNTSLSYLLGRVGFEVRRYTIRSEEAARIDDFFDMFGYATNRLKVPNMDNRQSWNYVKTRDVVISGSLPVDAMDAIKAMFNRGIRFWHGDIVGQYNLSNKVVNRNA